MTLRGLIVCSALSLPFALNLVTPGAAEAHHVCPDWGWFYFQAGGVARAGTGEVVEVSAGGIAWDTRNPEDITDWGGSFVRRDPTGAIVAQGTVTLGELVIWKEASCEVDNEWNMGGVAVFAVTLNGTDGSRTHATLSITVPAGHYAVEHAVGLKVAPWDLYFGEPLGAFGYFAVF